MLTRDEITYGRQALMLGLGVCASLALPGCGGEGEDDRARDPRVFTELTPEIEPAVRSTNRLATALYLAGATPGENLFFSPFSISVALGMTYAGARGTTADEMRSVLAIEADDDAYHHALGALNADLTGPHRRGYQLLSANAIFGERTTAFAAPFLDVLSTHYHAPLRDVSYVTDPEAARQTVNAWVSDATRTKIPELVPPGAFGTETRLTLANAIYFFSTWDAQFDAAMTEDQPFLLEDGSEVYVPTMSSEGRYRVASDTYFQLLELDYADRELSMGFFVPHARGGLAAAEAQLDTARMDALFGATSVRDCSVRVPRFEFRSELPLTQILKDLGMTTAFDVDADFSAMLEEHDPDFGQLFVADALHQAFVRVDESGTEAAAATVAVIAPTSAGCSVSVDQPFAFVIRDRATSALLFMGRVADPT